MAFKKYTDGGGAVPPLDVYGPPAPAPAPRPVAVDRVAYLQQQLQQQQAAAFEGGYGPSSAYGAGFAEDFTNKLTAGIVQAQPGLNQMALEAGRTPEYRRRQALREYGFEDEREARLAYTDATDPDAYRRARRYAEEIGFSGSGILNDITANPLYKAARFPIPDVIRDPVVRATEFGLERGPLGQAQGLVQAAGNVAGFDTPDVSREAAELLVPREVWDTALTLIPAAKARTVEELVAALSIGDVDAVRALKAAGQKLGQNVEPALRALASERGEMSPMAIPDAVMRLLPKRATGLTPEQVAGRWAELPVSSQKLIEGLAESYITPAQRKAITKAQQTSQAVSAKEAFEGTGTELERAAAAFKAMGGKQPQRFEPLAPRFMADEVDDIFSRLEQAHAEGAIGVFDRARANSALHLLFYGERIPGIRSEAIKPLNLMPNEIKLLGRIYGPEVQAMLPRSKEELLRFSSLVDIANLPRALITSLDVSAAGRQGIVLAARNPKEWAEAFGPMIKSMGSEQNFDRIATQLRRNPYFDDGMLHGLDVTDIGGTVTEAEEAFLSRFARNIPGVQMSERGYVMYLNYLRVKTYEKYAQRLERAASKRSWDASRLAKAKSDLAGFLNHATGRGDLGKAAEYTPALNALFFSPRYLASRFQTVWDLVRPGVDPAVRQIVFENLASFVGTGTAALALLSMTGAAVVELDPRSSDFGKVRIGDQRIEFWGGFQPIARFMAQMMTKERKDLFTGEISHAYPGETALRFFRSKLSPAGSMLYDYTIGEGKSFEGNKLFLTDPTPSTAWREFREKLLPLSIQDAIEAYNEQGIGAAATAFGVSALGGGTATFSASESQQAKIEKEETQGPILKKLEAGGYTAIPDEEFADHKRALSRAFSSGWEWDFDEFESKAEFKAAYVERVAPIIADEQDVSLARAKELADDEFEANSAIKALDAEVEKEQDDYWRTHKREAREAWESGAEFAPRKDIREELGIE